MFFITLIQPNIFLRVVRIYFPLFDTILQFPLSENAYPRSYYFNNQPSRRRVARGKKSPGRIVRRKPSTTRARVCIGLIEFDVIKVSRRSSLPPSPHLPRRPVAASPPHLLPLPEIITDSGVPLRSCLRYTCIRSYLPVQIYSFASRGGEEETVERARE